MPADVLTLRAAATSVGAVTMIEWQNMTCNLSAVSIRKNLDPRHMCIWGYFLSISPIYTTNWCRICKRLMVSQLTHWGRVTHICVGNLIVIGSDNGLSPGRHQAIIWTNAGILLIGTLGTNLSEILIEIQTFSFKKLRLKVSSAKWWPCGLGLNVLGKMCVTWTRLVYHLA